MRLKLLLIVFFYWPFSMLAQGQIDHIKNQAYLKVAKAVDCENSDGDNLSQRICANLAFQRSDSLLIIAYNELLQLASERKDKSLKEKIITLQQAWRKLRDQHCAIVFDQYKECGNCHEQAIAYLVCLTEMTESRIHELQKLKDGLN